MQKNALENYLRIVKGWNDKKGDIYNELADSIYNVNQNFVLPLDRELEFIFLEKNYDPNWSRKFLRFYIDNHLSMETMILNNIDLFTENKFNIQDDVWVHSESSTIATPDQSFILMAFEVFKNVFEIIEKKCIDQKLDIRELASEGPHSERIYSFILDKRKEEEENHSQLSLKFIEYFNSRFVEKKDVLDQVEQGDGTKIVIAEFDRLFFHAAEIIGGMSFEDIQRERANSEHINHKEDNMDNFSPDINLTFDKNCISKIYPILEGYFSSDDFKILGKLLKSENPKSTKILFKDNGNRLAHLFKLLYEHNFIKGGTKKSLEKWLSNHFTYLFRKEIKVFTPDYCEKCISRNYYECKNPLIEILNGEISKYTLPRRRADKN